MVQHGQTWRNSVINSLLFYNEKMHYSISQLLFNELTKLFDKIYTGIYKNLSKKLFYFVESRWEMLYAENTVSSLGVSTKMLNDSTSFCREVFIFYYMMNSTLLGETDKVV